MRLTILHITLYFTVMICLLFSQSTLSSDYKVAVRAHKGIENAIERWRATVEYLNQKLPSHSFTLVPIVSLKEISLGAENGKFDFILTNPSSFVEISQLYGATALATLNNKRANKAQNRFGSVIFTHARHDKILSISDLKDKTLMAVSERAFGGWQVPWLEMLDQGFNPHTELKSLIFASSKTQPEVVQAVLDGKVHAGVVRTDLLERLESAGKIDMRYLRILNNKDINTFPFFLSTELYPEWAFASVKHVPSDLAQQVAKHLQSIKPESDAAKKGKYIGWLPPEDYTQVMKLMKRLEVGPYAQQ